MSGNPIQDYPDEMAARLRGPAPHVRRVLLEAESHLLDATDRILAGSGDADPPGQTLAQQQAIAAFGAPADVARSHNRQRWRPGRIGGPVALALGRIAGCALVAMGLSGAALRALTGVVGRTGMFADPPSTHHAASACAYWLHLHPGASTCAQAYTLEASADAIVQRAAAGVLGGLLLVAVALLARRRPRWRSVLPARSTPAVMLAAFSVAAVALLAVGIDRLHVSPGYGAGHWLTDGTVSALAAAACAVLLLQRARRPAGPGSRLISPQTTPPASPPALR